MASKPSFKKLSGLSLQSTGKVLLRITGVNKAVRAHRITNSQNSIDASSAVCFILLICLSVASEQTPQHLTVKRTAI